MLIKKVFVAMLLSGSFSSIALAGGSHGDDDHEGSPVGQLAMASQATKTIRVSAMDTMRYKFSPQLDLQEGDIVRFVISNEGKISHEFSIGDKKEQKAHREMMRKMPGMVHADGNTITIKQGETSELTWQFKGDKEVIFACNIPGHFEAGMFAKVKIASHKEVSPHKHH